MPRTAMMAAFPAPDELQVTLANWMIKPFNEWGFRNVRQILPTANIGRSRTSIPLQLSLGHLEDVRFEGLDGNSDNAKGGCRGSGGRWAHCAASGKNRLGALRSRLCSLHAAYRLFGDEVVHRHAGRHPD